MKRFLFVCLVLNSLLALAEPASGELETQSILQAVWNSLISFWEAEVFVLESKAITLGKLAVGLLLLFTGIWIANVMSRLLGHWMINKLNLHEGVAAAIRTVLFYVFLITVVLTALKIMNVPLTVFTMLGGALAIGIGFGSQNLMSNFISGLIMLAERPIRVGDFVQIGELMGVVNHIGARSTRITTPQNVDIIVPNSTFLEDRVINWTLNDNKIRTSVSIGVAYSSDTDSVTRLLKQVAADHPRVLKNPEPIVLFNDFGNDALAFEVIFWMNMRRLIERRIVESEMRYEINRLFGEGNISIAFPQRDVHIDTHGKPLDIRLMEK